MLGFALLFPIRRSDQFLDRRPVLERLAPLAIPLRFEHRRVGRALQQTLVIVGFKAQRARIRVQQRARIGEVVGARDIGTDVIAGDEFGVDFVLVVAPLQKQRDGVGAGRHEGVAAKLDNGANLEMAQQNFPRARVNSGVAQNRRGQNHAANGARMQELF